MINPNYYPWGYDSDNGPEQWHKNYPTAKGRHQSPIEINNKEVHYDSSLLPWFASYDPGAAKTILNNGKTCRVVFDDSFDRSVLRGGPLPGVFRLRQLHFHWGSSDDHGSEHVVNGVRYAGELHVLHWNPKYSNYLDARRRTDGVAVLAIFLQVGETPKPEMKRILEEINAIKTKGKEAPFPNFDPSILFPKSHDYWTYHGSFTTPPCEECVTWIILREPIIVSSDQMAKLRSLSKNAENEPDHPLVDNWRPTQPRYFRMNHTGWKGPRRTSSPTLDPLPPRLLDYGTKCHIQSLKVRPLNTSNFSSETQQLQFLEDKESPGPSY